MYDRNGEQWFASFVMEFKGKFMYGEAVKYAKEKENIDSLAFFSVTQITKEQYDEWNIFMNKYNQKNIKEKENDN
jgi:hypothetical protein